MYACMQVFKNLREIDSRSLVRRGLLSESILSGFGQESVLQSFARIDLFEA